MNEQSIVPDAEQFLSSENPLEFAPDDYSGGCPCVTIVGVGFVLDAHCWRTGTCCPFSGVHVTGDISETTRTKIARHFIQQNPWCDETDWEIRLTPRTH